MITLKKYIISLTLGLVFGISVTVCADDFHYVNMLVGERADRKSVV